MNTKQDYLGDSSRLKRNLKNGFKQTLINEGIRAPILEANLPPELDLSINEFSIPDNMHAGFQSKSMEDLHGARQFDFSPFNRHPLSPMCEDTSHFNFEEHHLKVSQQ